MVLLPYVTEYILESPGTTAYYLFGAIGATLISIPIWLPLYLPALTVVLEQRRLSCFGQPFVHFLLELR